jgi:hypothetical protein
MLTQNLLCPLAYSDMSLALTGLFRNPQVMDDLRELQGGIHAFSKQTGHDKRRAKYYSTISKLTTPKLFTAYHPAEIPLPVCDQFSPVQLAVAFPLRRRTHSLDNAPF